MRLRRWLKEVEKAAGRKREVEPPLKAFRKKCENLPTLESYREVDLEEDDAFWEKWVKNPLENTQEGPRLDPQAIREVAEKANYEGAAKVREITSIMEKGAELGIEGEGRWPSEQANNPSTEEYGERLVDSLQSGILLGHISGPLTRQEVDTLGEVKIAPMDVRLKANGSARIIIDMSAPRPRVWTAGGMSRMARLGDGKALSPNAGMEGWKEFEECTMSSDRDFRKALYICGHGARMSKNDWAHAYKHVPVRKEDWAMQVLKFGGRFFVEKALSFGGGSSPTIFRTVASFLIEVVEKLTGLCPELNCMVLDDNCTVGRKDDEMIETYFMKYREVAGILGVELAGLEDPGKAFAPTTRGEVLGIMYDTKTWSWWVPEDKGTMFLALMWNIMEGRGARMEKMMSLMGKINHYSSLTNGKHERGFLYARMSGKEEDKLAWVALDDNAILQLWWWIVNIRVVQSVGAHIADPFPSSSASALVLYSDAAGGNSSRWKGWGCFCQEEMQWCSKKWPKYILNNEVVMTEKWGAKLTLLEGFAALEALVCWLPVVKRRGSVVLRVDNIGFCYAWRKQHSRDLYIYTLTKAMRDIEQMLEVRIEVCHVPRRSTVGDQIVDHLSKNEVEKVEELVGKGGRIVATSTLLDNWIRRPFVAWDLGRRILEGLKYESLGEWRNYVADLRRVRIEMGWGKRRRE